MTAIFYNNISSFYMIKGSLEKVAKYSKKALDETEEEIHTFISMVKEDVLATNTQFQKRIAIYILAKLNLAFSIENSNQPQYEEDDEENPLNAVEIYKECHNLCFKFLGQDSVLTEKSLNGIRRLSPQKFKFVHLPLDSPGKIVKHFRTSSNQTSATKASLKNILAMTHAQTYSSTPMTVHYISKADKNSPQYSSFKEAKQKDFIIRNSSMSMTGNKIPGSAKTESDDRSSQAADKKHEPVILSTQIKTRPKRNQTSSSGNYAKSEKVPASERKTASDYEKQKEKQNMFLSSLNQTVAQMQKQFEDNFPKIFELIIQEKEKSKTPSANTKVSAELAQQASKIKELEIRLLQAEKERNEKNKKEIETNLEKIKIMMAPRNIPDNHTSPRKSTSNDLPSLGSKPLIEEKRKEPNIPEISIERTSKDIPKPRIESSTNPTSKSSKSIPEIKSESNLAVVNQIEDPNQFRVMTLKEFIKSQRSDESHLSGPTAEGSTKNFGNNRPPSEFDILNTSRANSLEMERGLITKKQIILENNQKYWLICKAYPQDNEKYFKLEVQSNTSTKKITEEELKYSEYKWIMERCEYKDVMPIVYDKKHLKLCRDYIKYLIMPFVQIEIDQDSESMEINFSAKSRGLFTGLNSIEFLDKKCIVTFHHVMENIFRVVLTESSAGEDVLRIDIEFEKVEEFFTKLGGASDMNSNIEIGTRIVSGFDENADDDELGEAVNLTKALIDDRVEEVELDNYIIKNESLYPKIHGLLKEIEDFFQGVGYQQFSHISEEKTMKYLKVKVGVEMKKATLHFVTDNATENTFSIYQQNFHETFGTPPEGVKIKAGGKYIYKYSVFQKFFGVNFPDLDTDEKLGAISLLSEAVTLKTFDKVLVPDDFEKYSENPIMVVPIETGCYHRTYLCEKSRNPTPITLALVGIKGKPFGIKAVTYNRNEVKENGIFLYIDPSYWAKKKDSKAKTKSKKVETSPLLENFYLEYILKKVGWEIIKECLVVGHGGQKIELLGIKATKGYGNTDQLENILNNETIAKYYKIKEFNKPDQFQQIS